MSAEQEEKLIGNRRRSGDMVGKGSSTLELVYGAIAGIAFGLVSPFAGQPFDTIKTKMQADVRYAGQGSFAVTKSVIQTEGLVGLYRGILPMLASVGVQKTALFAANAGARRACENSSIAALRDPIPMSAGLKPSVLVGGLAASCARTAVETPFELIKVRSQTGGSFRATGGVSLASFQQLREMYTGVGATFGRTTLMLGSFFVMCDYLERFAPETMAIPLLGGFIKGGLCGTAGWAVAWPFEVVKSKVQGKDGALFRQKSAFQIMGEIVRSEGVRGLWRGMVPGALRSIASNGAGMAVYQLTQNMRSD